LTALLNLPVIAKVLQEALDKPIVTSFLVDQEEAEKFEKVGI
jgi:hypothetical protein